MSKMPRPEAVSATFTMESDAAFEANDVTGLLRPALGATSPIHRIDEKYRQMARDVAGRR